MKTKQLMDQAEKAMIRYVCKGLEGDLRRMMEQKVRYFFRNHAAKLTKMEIMDRMVTPMKALEWFNSHYCKPFRQMCDCDSDVGEADVCTIP